MIFQRDSFANDSGKWTNYTTNCAITYPRGVKKFVKSAKSWGAGGHIFTSPRVLNNGDRFITRFRLKTFTSGDPTNGDASFIELSLHLDNSNFTNGNYGLYLNGNAFQPLNYNPVTGHDVTPEIDETYIFIQEILGNSNMGLWFGTPGDLNFWYEIPGPFINREAHILLNIYSIDTIELIDYIAFDIGGF